MRWRARLEGPSEAPPTVRIGQTFVSLASIRSYVVAQMDTAWECQKRRLRLGVNGDNLAYRFGWRRPSEVHFMR